MSQLLYGEQDDVIHDLTYHVHDAPSKTHDVMGQARHVACHVHDIITTCVVSSIKFVT